MKRFLCVLFLVLVFLGLFLVLASQPIAQAQIMEPPIDIDIDIYPNRFPNQVFLSRNYTLYVAVLGSASFDVTTINSSTVRFGHSGAEASPVRAPLVRDLNGDGYLDAMYGFPTFDCGFQLGDTEGVLTATTTAATDLQGSDSVLVMP